MSEHQAGSGRKESESARQGEVAEQARPETQGAVGAGPSGSSPDAGSSWRAGEAGPSGHGQVQGPVGANGQAESQFGTAAEGGYGQQGAPRQAAAGQGPWVHGQVGVDPAHHYQAYGFPPPPPPPHYANPYYAVYPGQYPNWPMMPPPPPPWGYPPTAYPPDAQAAGVAQGPGLNDLVSEVASGGNGLSTLSKMLNFDDPDFWKGALVGAALVLLLTSESVQGGLFGAGGSASPKSNGKESKG